MANRSEPGKGEIVGIYILGPAERWCDSVVGGYNKTAMCGSAGEDYADSGWPIVVKVKAKVSRSELSQHLRDLADAVDDGFFIGSDAIENEKERLRLVEAAQEPIYNSVFSSPPGGEILSECENEQHSYHVEARASNFFMRVNCVLCGLSFRHDGIEVTLFEDGSRVGRICEMCMSKGPENFPSIVQSHVQKIKGWADALEYFSHQHIKMPTAEEWEHAKQTRQQWDREMRDEQIAQIKDDEFNPNEEIPF